MEVVEVVGSSRIVLVLVHRPEVFIHVKQESN